MGNMTSKIMNELHASVRQAMAGRNKRFGVALTFIAAAGPAFAQANTGGLCTTYVIIGCMVLVLAPSLVQAIGLSPSCS